MGLNWSKYPTIREIAKKDKNGQTNSFAVKGNFVNSQDFYDENNI